jgi:predicted transcriptional regulator
MRNNALSEPWSSLAESFGSVGALADHFGVTRRTINRWANGEMRMGGSAKKILDALSVENHLEKNIDTKISE